MDENDEELMSEWYQPTERELLPNIDTHLEKLAVTETKKTVRLKWLKFNDDVKKDIIELAEKSGVIEINTFLHQLSRFATSEQAFLIIKKDNRELDKQPNEIKKELEIVRKTTSKLIDGFIKLGDSERNALRQDLHSGLKYVFDGKLTQISVEDIVRFLHLIETTASIRKKETMGYEQNNPRWFIFRLHALWTDFVKEPNKRGNKARFIKLVEIVMNSIGYPSADVRWWVNEKLPENIIGGISF